MSVGANIKHGHINSTRNRKVLLVTPSEVVITLGNVEFNRFPLKLMGDQWGDRHIINVEDQSDWLVGKG